MGKVVRGKILRRDLAQFDGSNTTYSRVDATGGTISGAPPYDYVDVLEVYGSGSVYTDASISSAISTIGGVKRATLRFSVGTWTISSSITIPANLNVYIPAGVTISVDNGITLTVAGKVYAEDPNNAFSGSGTVTISDESSHFGVWWQTSAEASAGITPSRYEFKPGNVRRYGALGDGSNDDTTAIQNAVDSVANAGHTRVYLPTGDYKITSTITLSSGTFIEGESSGNYTKTGANLNIGSGTFAAITIERGARSTTIKRLRVEGTNTYTAGSIGIDFGTSTTTADTSNVLIEDLYLLRVATGIRADDNTGSPLEDQFSNVQVQNVEFREVGTGILLDSQNADGWDVNTCSFAGDTDGVYIDGCGYVAFRNCSGSFGTGSGQAFFHIPAGATIGAIVIDSCQCEGTDYFLYKVVGDASQIKIYNSYIDDNIKCLAQTHLTLINCRISDAVELDADGRLVDIGNVWQDNTYPLAVPTIGGNGTYVCQIGSLYTTDGVEKVRTKIQSNAVRFSDAPTYGASVTVDLDAGDFINIVANDGNIFTIENPTVGGSAFTPYGGKGGQRLTIRVKNTSGGALGTITWASKYKMTAFTNPANGFSRSITFLFDGTNWIETSRCDSDVPN